VLSVALDAGIPNRAQFPGDSGNVTSRNPHRAFPIFQKREDRLPCKLGIGSELAVFPTRESFKGANPKSPVPRSQQPANPAGRKLLARRRLPVDGPNTIEAKQPEFRSQPEITVPRLGDGVDAALEKPVTNPPRGVCVLTDVERGIQREGAREQRHKETAK